MLFWLLNRKKEEKEGWVYDYMENAVVYAIVIPKRKAYIDDVMKKIGIDYIPFDAVLKDTINRDELRSEGIIKKDSKIDRPENHGRIACHLSHIGVLREFLKGDKDVCFVFEDDIALPNNVDDIKQKIINILKHMPSDWQMFNFGKCWDRCNNMEFINQYVIKSIPVCRHAYAVTRIGAQILVNNTIPMSNNGDTMYRKLIEENQIIAYTTDVELFTQNRQEMGSELGNDKLYNLCHRQKTTEEKISVILLNDNHNPKRLRTAIEKLADMTMVHEIIIGHTSIKHALTDVEKVVNVDNSVSFKHYFGLSLFMLVNNAKYNTILYVNLNRIPNYRTVSSLINLYFNDRLNLYAAIPIKCDSNGVLMDAVQSFNMVSIDQCMTSKIVATTIIKQIMSGSMKYIDKIVENKGIGSDVLFNYYFTKIFQKVPITITQTSKDVSTFNSKFDYSVLDTYCKFISNNVPITVEHFKYQEKIVVWPSGGLCNKLRVTLSYFVEAQLQNKELHVIWDTTEHCPGYFLDYFEPIDGITFYRSNENNLKLDYKGSAWHPDHNYRTKFEMYKNLKVLPHIQSKIEDNILLLGNNYVAVHVRRTDHVELAKKNNAYTTDDDFFNFIDEHKQVESLYVATDNQVTFDMFKARYDSKMKLDYTDEQSVASIRQTTIEQSIIDLFTCVYADQFKGSGWSSFSGTILSLRKCYVEDKANSVSKQVAYCINLDETKENFVEVKSKFSDYLNLERVSAVKAQYGVSGAFALCKSNNLIYNKKHENPYVIILEDDVYPTPKFKEYWDQVLSFIQKPSKEWDIISLEFILTYDEPILEEFNDLFLKTSSFRNTGFMIYNTDFLKRHSKMLSNMKKIDMELGYDQNVIKLVPKIIMVKQKAHESSISGKNVNYEKRYNETQKYIEVYLQ